MRKGVVIAGIICLVIGALLFFYGFYSTFWLSIHDVVETIPVGYSWKLSIPGVDSGMKVRSEYTSSDEVRFYIYDEHNFDLFERKWEEMEPWIFCDEIYYSEGKSDSYTFAAPKDDTYWIVLCNTGDNEASASAKISTERVWIKGMLYFFGLVLLVPIGIGGIIGGLRAKPKVEQVASKLLGVVKLYGRMEMSELATKLKVSEADIESALIKLKSSGESIKLDVETKEVIYSPPKEE